MKGTVIFSICTVPFFIYNTFMEIVRASVLGFCFGVRRAVELAEKALIDNPGKNVYSLGPLIHNETALKALGEKGLKIVEENQLELIPDESVVIIRAHGVPLSVINELKKKNAKIIEATCPRVKASQKMVGKYNKADELVILTGDKNHGEVKGIAGYAGSNFVLIETVDDAEKLVINDENMKVVLLSQTTFSPKQFVEIENILKNKIKNLTVYNTICPATNERQEALLELCKEVDGVLVIGGKSSSNTIRLYQTAAANCGKAAHIQGVEDIPEEFFKLKKVGITAGASTPDGIIDAVTAALNKRS